MDPASPVRTDAIPAMATVVAPGAVISSPYLWAVLSSAPDIRGFLDRHEAIALSGAVLIWVVAGFAVESLGSYVEVYWIGQRYLRRLLVSFKFELNMGIATLGGIPGVLALGFMGRPSGLVTALVAAALLLAAAALFRAATDTAQVLADLRSRLLQGVGEPPFSANGEPSA